MDGLCNSDELAMIFVEKYSLKFEGESDLARFKQAIRRAMVRLGILEKYVRKVNPETNHHCNYYTARQRDLIEKEPKFHDYLLDNSTDEKIRSRARSKEIEKKIEAYRDRFIENQDELVDGASCDDSAWRVSKEDMKRQKAMMMLTAVFELFFSSFDEAKLWNDMELDLQGDDLGLDPDHIIARENLAHPEGIYFRRRDAADHKEA